MRKDTLNRLTESGGVEDLEAGGGCLPRRTRPL
jgi:hypothetical protein